MGAKEVTFTLSNGQAVAWELPESKMEEVLNLVKQIESSAVVIEIGGAENETHRNSRQIQR